MKRAISLLLIALFLLSITTIAYAEISPQPYRICLHSSTVIKNVEFHSASSGPCTVHVYQMTYCAVCATTLGTKLLSKYTHNH